MNELEATRAKLKCLEMVDGTGLDWWKVVKSTTSEKLSIPPTFGDDKERYELAIGVLEGKPVWEADTLYLKSNGIKVIAQRGFAWTIANGRSYEFSECSWNPPKPKTVMVELTVEDAQRLADVTSYIAVDLSSNLEAACRKALEELK